MRDIRDPCDLDTVILFYYYVPRFRPPTPSSLVLSAIFDDSPKSSRRSADRLRARSFHPARSLFSRFALFSPAILNRFSKCFFPGERKVRSSRYIGSSILFGLLHVDVVAKLGGRPKDVAVQAALLVLSNARRSCHRPIVRSRSLDPRGFLTRSAVDIQGAEQRLEDRSTILLLLFLIRGWA